MMSVAVLKQQESWIQALSVVLQHPAVAAEQRNICILLQVSKAVRAVTQQSASGITNINFSFELSTAQLPRVTCFATWLAKYIGHLQTIATTMVAPMQLVTFEEQCTVQAAAQQLIELGFRAAGSSAAHAASTAGSAAKQVCQLCSYISNIPISSGLLAALPLDNLTCLEVQTPNSGNWALGLGKLLHLNSLKLQLHGDSGNLSNDWLPEINKLTQLTNLELYRVAPSAASEMQRLPTGLQDLTVTFCSYTRSSMLFNLQHLVSLRWLELRFHKGSVPPQVSEGCVLPARLPRLVVWAECPVIRSLGVHKLQQLHTLDFTSWNEGEALHDLVKLSQLRCLSLTCGMEDVRRLGSAMTWRHLPALHELNVHSTSVSVLEMQGLAPHLAAITQLTKLVVEISYDPEGVDDVFDPSNLVICRHLTGLTGLKALAFHMWVHGEDEPTLVRFNLVVHDAQYLTALTALTSLHLTDIPYVDLTTLALLAGTLTNLEHLYLANIPEPGYATSILPVVNGLTKLKYLELGNSTLEAADAQRGLRLLTGLTGLTKLGGFDQAGQDAIDAFWAMINCVDSHN